MAYSLNRFLKPLKETDKVIRIYDDRNFPLHSVNPFAVIRLQVNNNNLIISLQGNRSIVLDFPSFTDATEARIKLQKYIDEIVNQTIPVVDVETEKFVEKIIQSQGGLFSLNGSTFSNQQLIFKGDENFKFVTSVSGASHSINLYFTGLLPIEKGGLNNDEFTESQLLISSGDAIVSSGFSIGGDDVETSLWPAKRIIEEIQKDPFNYKEVPNGEIDGINCKFSLVDIPIVGSEHVFLNGLLQNLGGDYFLEENVIIFYEAPIENSLILCTYKKNLSVKKNLM
jgi:hypothetical protein